jgi:hypothetical protein
LRLPTALIATNEFAGLAATERTGLGMAFLPITTITHPLGDQPLDVVRSKAEAAVDSIIHVLTTSVERLEDEERTREYPQSKSVFRSKTIFA